LTSIVSDRHSGTSVVTTLPISVLSIKHYFLIYSSFLLYGNLFPCDGNKARDLAQIFLLDGERNTREFYIEFIDCGVV